MNNQKIKLLIVDDEEMLCRNLEAFFKDEGFDVVAESNGEDALAKLRHNVFDLGFFDMRLPGINGNELILKAHEINPDMKFIIYTGSSNYMLPANLINIGISEEDVFIKPVAETNLFLKRIKQLLKRL